MLIVTALALLLLSVMISMRLGSGGAPLRRIRLVLIELWGGFALIIGLFAWASQLVGTVPRQEHPNDEIAVLLHRFATLPPTALAGLVVALVVGLAILGHLCWLLGALMRQYTLHVDAEPDV